MSPVRSVDAAAIAAGGWPDCRLCGSRLQPGRWVGDHQDDRRVGLCAECQTRPEARRFGRTGAPGPAAATAPAPFTAADRALIRATHGYMPAAQLLAILNDRLAADGRGARPHTLEQLRAEVQGLIDPSAGRDWAGLRQVLAAARRAGVLAAITPQVLDDFAGVFQLSPAQHTALRDVLRAAQDQERSA